MNIWNYEKHLDSAQEITTKLHLPSDNKISPLDSYTYHGHEILVKREDQNPTGSHKDRGMAFELSSHISHGINEFAISSSGNASISAAGLLRGRDEEISIFLSPRLSDNKLRRLADAMGTRIESTAAGRNDKYDNFRLKFTKRPVSRAFRYAQSDRIALLRGSTSETGHIGFMTIAFELAEQAPDITDIFIPTSSGTTAMGIYEGYRLLIKNDTLDSSQIPKIHIVQTTRVNTIAREFTRMFTPTSRSLAHSIVDRVGHRKSEVVDLVNESGGNGWVISDDEIKKAIKSVIIDYDNITAESAMAFAAYEQALEVGDKMERPVILMTGTALA